MIFQKKIEVKVGSINELFQSLDQSIILTVFVVPIKVFLSVLNTQRSQLSQTNKQTIDRCSTQSLTCESCIAGQSKHALSGSSSSTEA